MNALEGRTIVGRYLLRQRLGRGGHGDVFLADDTRLGSQVALKVLRTDLDEVFTTELRRRFELEAKRVASLHHPNTVRVFDYGEDRSEPAVLFLVMELLSGEDLESMVKRTGGLDPHAATTILIDVCGPLVEAHANGIVHRDLAPKNVIMAQVAHEPTRTHVKLIDFGIAKYEDAVVTADGQTLGTLEYMSPEQAQGLELDARSDIYAAGVMLVELLTGRVPFSQRSEGGAAQILMAHVMKPRPWLAELAPELLIAPELEAIARTCLQISRQRRYHGVGQLRRALERARTGLDAADPIGTLSRHLPTMHETEREMLVEVLNDRLRRSRDPVLHRQLLMRRGVVARDGHQNYALAEESFTRVLRLVPDDVRAHQELAETHARARRWDTYVEVVQAWAALVSDEEADDLSVKLAKALADELGDTYGARTQLRTVLLRNPGHQGAEEALSRLATTTGVRSTASATEVNTALGDLAKAAAQLQRPAETSVALERLDQLMRHPASRVAFEALHVVEDYAETHEDWTRLVTAWRLRAGRTDDAHTRAALWADAAAVYLNHLDLADEALGAIEHAIEGDPARSDLYGFAERVAYTPGAWRRLVALYEGVADRIDAHELRLTVLRRAAELVIQNRAHHGHTELAERLLRRAREHAPDDVKTLELLTQLYREASPLEAWAEALSALKAIHPAHPACATLDVLSALLEE